LLESPSRKQDQLVLLLYEQNQAEMFYKLLTYPHQPIIFYEKVVKILFILLKTKTQKKKSRLKLSDIGHAGLINLMAHYEISAPMIKRFIEQVAFTETSQTYSAVLSILGIVHGCGLDIKSEASRQLLAIIVSKTGAAKGFAKQLGWQENITRLLTVERRRAFTLTNPSKVDSSHAESRSSGAESVKLTSNGPNLHLPTLSEPLGQHVLNLPLTTLSESMDQHVPNVPVPILLERLDQLVPSTIAIPGSFPPSTPTSHDDSSKRPSLDVSQENAGTGTSHPSPPTLFTLDNNNSAD
ncbi:unnamed protein product, partial [Lymnaea stagnalis]